jgi:hypothetical protein
MNENFIRTYDNVLDANLIKTLLQMIDQQVVYNTVNDKNRQDKQLALDPYWPTVAMDINNCLLNKCVSPYLEDFPYLKTQGPDWWSGVTLLQKTEPMGGFHTFHGENIAWANKNRVMAWMIYLNDVEEGGETEFLYQQVKLKPTKNTAVIWPGGFTHLHRGNPPMSTKYILTGWISSMSNMPRFTISEDS